MTYIGAFKVSLKYHAIHQTVKQAIKRRADEAKLLDDLLRDFDDLATPEPTTLSGADKLALAELDRTFEDIFAATAPCKIAAKNPAEIVAIRSLSQMVSPTPEEGCAVRASLPLSHPTTTTTTTTTTTGSSSAHSPSSSSDADADAAELDRLFADLDLAPLPTSTSLPAHDPRASMRALIDLAKRNFASTISPAITSSTTRTSTTSKIKVAPVLAPLPAWRSMTSAQKFRAAVRAAAGHDGLALTLNLSPAREKALVASDDPLRLFSGYLNRELAKVGLSGLPYALAVEVAPGGKVHLHGAVVAGIAAPDALKRALMRAGGEIAGRAGSRQLKLDAISGADGWADYCLKDQRQTTKTLKGDRLTFVSNDLVRLAKPISTTPARSRAATTSKAATTTAPATPRVNPAQKLQTGPVSPAGLFGHPMTGKPATAPTRPAPRVLHRQRSRAAGSLASRCRFPASPPRPPAPQVSAYLYKSMAYAILPLANRIPLMRFMLRQQQEQPHDRPLPSHLRLRPACRRAGEAHAVRVGPAELC
ncbi:hypothetical protein [Cereibacter changlensis]|uniref:hypothetical protein n=1 Tax=Cereibacter changlensis TaxID=402884 RepID=UPI001475FEA9|nr:hypothetical protein [Cereibacter changlensis]